MKRMITAKSTIEMIMNVLKDPVASKIFAAIGGASICPIEEATMQYPMILPDCAGPNIRTIAIGAMDPHTLHADRNAAVKIAPVKPLVMMEAIAPIIVDAHMIRTPRLGPFLSETTPYKVENPSSTPLNIEIHMLACITLSNKDVIKGLAYNKCIVYVYTQKVVFGKVKVKNKRYNI